MMTMPETREGLAERIARLVMPDGMIHLSKETFTAAIDALTALEATNAELRRRLDQQARKVMRAGTALLMGARPYPVGTDTLPARSMVEDWRLKQLADALAEMSKPFDAEGVCQP